jgi:hypothetical protein
MPTTPSSKLVLFSHRTSKTPWECSVHGNCSPTTYHRHSLLLIINSLPFITISASFGEAVLLLRFNALFSISTLFTLSTICAELVLIHTYCFTCRKEFMLFNFDVSLPHSLQRGHYLIYYYYYYLHTYFVDTSGIISFLQFLLILFIYLSTSTNSSTYQSICLTLFHHS